MTTRCTDLARGLGTNPLGTAGSYDELVLVEHPLPWPADAADLPSLTPLVRWMAHDEPRRRRRVQLIVTEDASTAEVAVYRRPAGPFRSFVRATVTDSIERVSESAIDLLTAADDRFGEPDHGEVLICTHGRRDRCCGALGTRLERRVSDDLGAWDRIRVRRTSHLGGHRFAPTALVLPHGTVWAWLTPELLEGIVTETAPARDAARHLRGVVGLDGAEVQVADAAMFARHGWQWLSQARAASIERHGSHRAEVRITGSHPEAASISTVIVDEVALVPVPVCGKPIELAKKSEPQYRAVEAPRGLQ